MQARGSRLVAGVLNAAAGWRWSGIWEGVAPAVRRSGITVNFFGTEKSILAHLIACKVE